MQLKPLLKLIWISALIALLINFINFVVTGSIRPWAVELEGFLINFMFSITITTVNRVYFDKVSKYYSWTQKPAKRLLIGAIGSVIITMATLFICLFITRVFIYKETVARFFENQDLDWYLFGLTFTMVMTIIFHAFYFYRELQAQKVKEQKVIARTATAQFDALKNQLDPHFLFNSLNVLVSLIEENPKAATKFTTSLSKVYRYVLEQRNKKLVSVDDELSFARAYVGLLKTRFEDSIQIDIPEKSNIPDAQVVPLSLQLLLENAVKHNIVSDSKPLKLRIYEEGNQLIVENNLQKKQIANSGSGVGLQNIAARYQLLTNRKMSISQNNSHFKVQIPILTNQPEVLSPNNYDMTTLEDIKLIKAKERVKSIKEFYDDVLRTALIILLLAAVNYVTSEFPWAIFPAIGMSIGLLFKYLRTYEKNVFLGKPWEERKINELMNNKDF